MKMWPVIVSAEEQILALKQALAERDEALRLEREQRAAMAGELRVARTERDLLKERLNKFLRKLFDARSEALANQKELFFNEAEADGAAAQPVEEEPADEPTIGFLRIACSTSHCHPG